MSWDVWLAADTGNHAELARLDVLDWNYTSNVGPMLRLVMGDTMASLNGLSGLEAAELLGDAVTGMEVDVDACRALNPPNGWGNYDSFIEALRELLDACSQHPKAIVETST